MRLGGRVGRLVSTVVVPLLAGATLAAFCVLTFSALSSESRGSHHLSVLGSQPQATRAARLPQGDGDNGRYEHLVASAAAHEVGAEQAVAHALQLRNEAATAQSKAAALQSSLAQLLDEEANRDKAAERLASKAQALDNKATHDVVARRSLSSAWSESLAAAKAKRNAFLVDEKRADEDKVKAKALLNQERKLFEKSFAMVDQEAKAQAKVDRKNSELAAERKKQRHIKDREKVVVEEPQQYQHTIREAQQQSRRQEEATQNHAQQAQNQMLSVEQKADETAEERLKRPLWGNRKWPSYYDNALTDPGSEKLFKADEPSHPAPRQLEMGDDNQVPQAFK
jgi:hypothetical protein